jgi:hypothetical protein
MAVNGLDMVDYGIAFEAGATQLRGFRNRIAWYRAGVPVETAIEWTNAGYLYEEAAPLIADGITPQMATEASAAMLGGGTQEEQAMNWIDLHRTEE